MNEVIKIDSLEVFGYHGTFHEEKILGQKYIINLEIQINEFFNNLNDDLNKTVDYVSLVEFVREYFRINKRDLLESIASEVVCEIFKKFDKVKGVNLEILKPACHLNENFKGMRVCLSKKKHRVYLSLGSNLGDREKNLNSAYKILEENNIKILNKSKIIETEPYGGVVQDNFLNSVIEVDTILNPQELIGTLLSIEEKLKRDRKIKWGPRTIDLDILIYDNEIIVEDNLIIPHYDMHRRNFVLEPLCEINKFAYHPRIGKFAFEMLEDLK